MLKEYQDILSNQSVRYAVHLWGCAVGSLHYRLISNHMNLALRNRESATIALTFTLHPNVLQSKKRFLWEIAEICAHEYRAISLGTFHAALRAISTRWSWIPSSIEMRVAGSVAIRQSEFYCPSLQNCTLTKSTSVKPIYGWWEVNFNEVVDQIFTKPPISEG